MREGKRTAIQRGLLCLCLLVKMCLGTAHGDDRTRDLALLQSGVDQGLALQAQPGALAAKIACLSDAQMQSLQQLLGQNDSDVAQMFLLKAYAVGENWTALVQYAREMRGHSDADIIHASTIRAERDVRQQFQDACAPAVVETLAGEVDPRYAWELHKLGDLAALDPSGDLADQQKQWLEEYGGVAAPRGTSLGRGIPLTAMINDKIGPLLHARFRCVAVVNLPDSVDAIDGALRQGMEVPLCVTWTSVQTNHFLLAEAARGRGAGREMRIHDPWTGRTVWVSEAALRGDAFSTFGFSARLGWYYLSAPA